MPLFFEDFTVGVKYNSSLRKVTNEGIAKFADLTGDRNKLHVDPEYAKRSGFKGTIAHGLLTLSLSLGLWHSLNLTNGTILAFLGLNNVSFKAPVYPGDSLKLISEIATKRGSKSRQDAGVLTVKEQMFNQRNELVLEAELILLLKKSRH